MLAILLTSVLANASTAASSTGEPKVPAPLPFQPDVKTAPIAPSPASLAPIARPAPTAAATATAPARKPPAGSAPGAPRTVLDRVWFDVGPEGELWARGAAWKARFDAQGVEYVPAFGSAAPRNFPVRFELSTVRRGSVELARAPYASVRRYGDRVRIDHGTFAEDWATSMAAVEQSFTFEALPGTGDLELALAVSSELRARADGADLVFENELGAVRYGGAVAIDARGERCAARTRFADGRIEIVVDGAFLARARLPLVVDPVIATFPVAATTEDDLRPDAAYDPVQNRWLVVWERTFSQTDKDVWAQEFDAGGAAVPGTLSAIDFTTSSWVQPRVAYNALSQVFLTVAQAAPFGGNREVWGRIRHAGTGALDAQFQISSSTDTGEKLEPDVGGDPALAGPTYFLVAWTRTFSASDRDIHARLVAPDGTLQGPSTMLIDNTGGTYDNHPSVSKSDGLPPFAEQRWNIAWDRELSSTDRDIHAAQVRWDGAIVSPSTPVYTGSGDTRYPSASSLLDPAGGPRRWCIAFTETFGTQADIDLLLMDGVSTVGGTNLSVAENGGALELEDQIYPSIDCDGARFVVAYAEQYQASFDYDVYASTVVPADTLLIVTEAHQSLALSTTVEWIPRVATRHASGGAQLRALVTWWDGGTPTTQSDVEAGLYDAEGGGPVLSWCGSGHHHNPFPCPCASTELYGHGCANSVFSDGALLVASGRASVSNDSFLLQGFFMPNSTALYFQGDGDAGENVLDDGVGCVGGSIIRLGTTTNVSNASQYPGPSSPSVSVRGALPAVGGTRFYQCYYRNAANFCTPATSNRTNGVEVVWLP